MDNKNVTITITGKDNASKAADSAKKSVGGLSSAFKTGALAGAGFALAQKGISMALSVVSDSIGSAVKRVDTMNNFPKVMSNLGISADQSKVVIKSLSDSLKGLPTSLDTAASSVQRLTTKTKDVNVAKDIFLALNNAVLAGGAPMEIQSSAMEQFSQAFAKGKPDMMEWRSMMSAMPAQLDQVAKKMNMPSADALGQALRTGKISMDDFSKAMIELNNEGINGLPNLAQQAKNATGGIQTSVTNMKTAITRGIANIINAIGAANIAGAISGIGRAFEMVISYITKFVDYLKNNQSAMNVFKGAVIGLGVALTVALLPALGSIAASLAGAALAAAPFILAGMAIAAIFNKYPSLFGKIKSAISSVVNIVKMLITGDFKGGIFGLSEDSPVIRALFTIRETVIKVYSVIKDQLVKAWNDVVNAIKPLLPALKVIGMIIGGLLLAAVAIFVGAIVATVAIVIGLGLLIARVFGWTIQFISAILQGIWILLQALWAGIVAAVMWVVNSVIAYYRFLWNVLVAIFNGIWNAIKAVWNGIVAAVMWVVNSVIAYYRFLWNVLVAGFNWIRGVISGVWNGIVSAARWLVNAVRSFFSGLWNGIVAIFNGIGGWFRSKFDQIVAAARAVKDGISNAISGAFDSAKNAVSSAVGWIKDQINSIIDKINSVVSKIPGLGGAKIPGFASGVTNFGGGVALVGEQGPELVTLPRGSNVIPAPQTADIMSGKGKVSMVNNFNVYNQFDLQRAARDIGYEVER